MSLRLSSYGIGQSVTDVLYMSFNQDASYLCIGTVTGFDVYSCCPFAKVKSRTFRNGGLAVVEMMHVSNIFALVGGGAHPCFHPTKVVVWDESKEMCLGEVPLASEVRGVRMRRDKLVIALDTLVYVYSMNLECQCCLETSPNPMGLLALCFIGEPVLAHAGLMSGQVRIQNLNQSTSQIISAHNNPLGMLVSNLDGTLIASASVNGTVIKVYDVASQKTMKEVRRGSTTATVYCVCFSRDSKYLACVAESGTVHIFSLLAEDKDSSDNTEAAAANRKSRFAFFGNVVAPSLFDAEWSFAWYTCPVVPAICAFAPADNELLVAMYDGTFFVLRFDRHNGGECACISRHVFTSREGC